MRLYMKQQRHDDYVKLMRETAVLPNAPLGLMVQYADYLAAMGQMAEAERQFRRAMAAGLDTAAVREAQRRYPEIKILP